MLSLFTRALLIAGGAIASWFVANDALNYEVIKMVVAIFIFVLMVAIATYWRSIWGWIKGMSNTTLMSTKRASPL